MFASFNAGRISAGYRSVHTPFSFRCNQTRASCNQAGQVSSIVRGNAAVPGRCKQNATDLERVAATSVSPDGGHHEAAGQCRKL